MNEFTKFLTQSDLAYKLLTIPIDNRDNFPADREPFVFSCEGKTYRTFSDQQNRIRGIDLPQWFSDHPDFIPNSELSITADKKTQTYSIDIIAIADAPTDEEVLDQDTERIQEAVTLSLEKDIEKHISLEQNIQSIDPSLEIIGTQYRIEVGRVDVLAKDKH